MITKGDDVASAGGSRADIDQTCEVFFDACLGNHSLYLGRTQDRCTSECWRSSSSSSHWGRLRFPSGIIPQGTVKSSSQDFNFIRSSLNPHIKATSRFIHKRWKLTRCYTFENRDEMFFAELLEHHNWGPLATLIGISKCVWPPASFFGTQKFAPYQNSSCLQFCTLVDLLPSFRDQSDFMASIMKRMFVTFSLFYR